MKKNIIILFVSLLIIGSSCTKFLGVNEVNPNNASAVPAKLLLPAALNSIATTIDNPDRFRFVYVWYGEWSISTGYAQPTNLARYELQNSDYQNAFQEFYISGQNLTAVENVSQDPNECNYLAIAKIMKAYIMQNLVDCWGDVPYTEAYKADAGILKPKYDKQKDIYEDLIVQLDKSISLIQGAPSGASQIPTASDIIYQGDMSKWLKFANTLKLRILVHQSAISGRDAYIKGAIAKTVSVGYLGAGESALVNPGFTASTNKMNPFYTNYFKADGTQASDGVTYDMAGKDAVDFLVATADPRIGQFFSPYSGNLFAGNFLGQGTPPFPEASTSRLGYSKTDPSRMVGSATKPAPLLTDFESLFIQAEATERGFMTGTGKTLYESAVTQSFVYMGLQPSAATTFLATPKVTVNYDLAPNKITLLLVQKWVALNGIAPVEIWTDIRRTGIPSFIHFTEDTGKKNATPPVRLLYPQRELTVNNDNVLAVGTIDPFKSKIFWQN